MGSRLENNSKNVRKRIENHTFSDEQGEEYQGSTFGGFSDYMRRKKIKLQNLDAEIRSQSTDRPKIFRGVVAQVNGYTQPSLSDLHHLIVTHGGGFLQYLDGKTACTHIIASQLTPKKKAEFARYRIVKPAWVVDSVKAGKLLPWDNYRVVDEGVSQKVLSFDNGQFSSQANRKEHSYRGQTDTSWYTSRVKGFAEEVDRNTSNTFGSSDSLQRATSLIQDQHGSADDAVRLDHSPGDEEDNQTVKVSKFHPSPVLEETRIAREDDFYAGADGDAGDTDPSEPVKSPTSLMSEPARALTAEEHNAILLQNPHMAKSSTANPDFLNQYYRESRLHHLSSWKAELKAQLQARAMEKADQRKPRHKGSSGARRYIMHVDFDSFFAAVSLRKHAHLIDKPVVIAHGSGPGSEIASCNYPARNYGIKNGMWMKTALELCSDLKVLPYDFKAYEEASRHFYDSILAMDGIVQSISIDEALIDVSEQCIHAGGSDGKAVSEGSIYREQTKAAELAQALRSSVKEKTGCDVSVGMGGNILLAKVALRRAKPAGQHLIKPEEILDFVGNLTVTDLPGVAYSLGNKLEELGVKYVKDIRALSKERLINALGPKTGEKLWDYSRGIDKVEVGDQAVRKSVSAEVNWGIRFVTQQQAEEFVQSLCDELHRRLLENAVKGKQLTMKIMRKAADAGMDPPKNLGHGKCDTFNKSVILGVATNDKEILGKEAISVLRGYGFSPGELRGLGVQMQKLEPLKPVQAANTLLDGSQRRLTFKKPLPSAITADTKAERDSAAADLFSHRPTEASESIEEVPTPEKKRSSLSVQGAIQSGLQDVEKPLNMLGTQFIIPSQIDPTVLEELPEDIRAKLIPKIRSIPIAGGVSALQKTTSKSRSVSPSIHDSEYALPSQSQLDPETLAALPEDVKQELMAHYRTASKSNAPRAQSLLPQSPRKIKPVSKKITLTPTKKHKISSLIGKRGPKSTKNISGSTLTQSNFVSMPRAHGATINVDETTDQDISKSFLEELPEDIRAEILAEQKRNRLKLKSGLDVGTSRKRPRVDNNRRDLPRGQQKIHLPALPEKPTFTARKLSTISELRDAMSAWVQEFSIEDELGPYPEDVSALGQYLSRVVLEEKDMDKASSVISWLSYLIDDWPFDDNRIRDNWSKATTTLQNVVQSAVISRGLPPVDFS